MGILPPQHIWINPLSTAFKTITIGWRPNFDQAWPTPPPAHPPAVPPSPSAWHPPGPAQQPVPVAPVVLQPAVRQQQQRPHRPLRGELSLDINWIKRERERVMNFEVSSRKNGSKFTREFGCFWNQPSRFWSTNLEPKFMPVIPSTEIC